MSLALQEWERDVLQWVAWGVAAAWMWKAADVVRNVPTLPNLTGLDWDVMPEGMASLTVVVPARNEAKNLAATLDALVLADYPKLQVLVIDDRSTDETGTIADAYVIEYAQKMPGRLRVIHVPELPEGWLGKTFALEVGTDNSESDYLLYTDADVLFSPSILRRSVAFAEATKADHLVVMPTAEIRSWGEGVMLGFFQVLGVWASRLWKVHDPLTKDFLGVGAFNMVRRDAMRQLGGWEPQRMSVLEDLTLGMRMKAAGMRQRVAYAPGLVLVHWASGAFGLVRVMTKNLFSAFNFQPALLAGAVGWLVVFCLLPVAGLFWWGTLLPSLLTLCAIGATYRVMGEVSLIDARFGWSYALGALAFIWAMLRSMMVVLWRGGVVWRGTHYRLKELRQHNSPWKWRRAVRRPRG